MEIKEFGNRDRPLLRRFVQFGWDVYRDEPRHVPPLRMELLGSALLGQKGLLTAEHPFHRKAEVRYFMAFEGGRELGRVAACENRAFTEHQDAGTGFFGFFECLDDRRAAHALLDAAARWLVGRGLSRVVREQCDEVARIPIAAGVESLNASVAAGVALYAVAQARSS